MALVNTTLRGSSPGSTTTRKAPKAAKPKKPQAAPHVYTRAPYRANITMGRIGFVEGKHDSPAEPKVNSQVQRKKPKTTPARTTRATVPAPKVKTGGTAARTAPASSGTAAVGRPAGTSAGARNRSRQNTSAGKAAGTQTAETVTTTAAPSSSLYDAARRNLQADRDRADAVRQQRVADMAKFDEFMRQAREASNSTLQQQFAASATQAQQTQSDVAARVSALADQLKGQVGGSADVAKAAGITATNQAYGFRAQADAASSAANAFNQSNLMQRNVERQNEDFARSADMRATNNQRYDQFLANLDKQGRNIDLEEAKAKITQANADRQYELDKQSADFLNQYKSAQLGIAQTNAETSRINAQTKQYQIKNQASLNNRKLALQQQVAAGNLTLKQANLQLRREIAASNLSESQKNRAMKLKIANGTAANAMKDSPTWLQKFVTTRMTQNGVTNFNAGGDPFRAATVRGAIDAMAAQYPNMTQTQATQLLASQFGTELMQSNINTPTSYIAQIRARFKRG